MLSINKIIPRRPALVPLSLPLPAANAQAQKCKYRGELDPMYCDESKDMVADTPIDANKLKHPGTMVFTYTPVEDQAFYEKIFAPFTGKDDAVKKKAEAAAKGKK